MPAPQRRWLGADERGSVTAVTDASGVAIAIDAYDESGVPAKRNVGRFGYTGQAWLAELGAPGQGGVYYYKARMYDPTTARFLQSDPIGYAGGMNLYAYVRGDPVNYTDPSGLISFTQTCTGGTPGYSISIGQGPNAIIFVVAGTPRTCTYSSYGDTLSTAGFLRDECGRRGRGPATSCEGDEAGEGVAQEKQSGKPRFCSSPLRKFGAGLVKLGDAGKFAGKSVAIAGGVGVASGVFAPEGLIAIGIGAEAYAYSEIASVTGSVFKAFAGDFSGAPGVGGFVASQISGIGKKGNIVTGAATDMVPSMADPCK